MGVFFSVVNEASNATEDVIVLFIFVLVFLIIILFLVNLIIEFRFLMHVVVVNDLVEVVLSINDDLKLRFFVITLVRLLICRLFDFFLILVFFFIIRVIAEFLFDGLVILIFIFLSRHLRLRFFDLFNICIEFFIVNLVFIIIRFILGRDFIVLLFLFRNFFIIRIINRLFRFNLLLGDLDDFRNVSRSGVRLDGHFSILVFIERETEFGFAR